MGRMNLSSDVRESFSELVAIRRDIHKHPEAGFQERKTAALVRSKLRSYGVEHKAVCGTGTVAIVRGSKPGPTLLIRADMDALPLLEQNTIPYASRHRGMMHA